MQQYLLSIYQPDGITPPPEFLEKVMREVDAWNQELRAAGAWVLTGLLHPADIATVVRVQDDQTLITDGPYLEGKEHIGGFEVIQTPDLDAALKWASKLARVISPLAVEVRPFQNTLGG
ncbi:YciI family protein [Rugosimonospora acidiphila]|uniref:YciI family protein n=1 Tax=Rugosimonospora acidiphila TaxID=556531 RepID=A0ABP9S8J8_9ACTN